MRKDYESPVSEVLLIRLENNFVASVDKCRECYDDDCPAYKGKK